MLKPKFYESEAHRISFERKVQEWHCDDDPERYAALYILLASPNIRDHERSVLMDKGRIIRKERSYTDNSYQDEWNEWVILSDSDDYYQVEWITHSDSSLIRVALSVFNEANYFSAYDLRNFYSSYILEGFRLYLGNDVIL